MRRFAKLERRFKDNGEAQAKGENITLHLLYSAVLLNLLEIIMILLIYNYIYL